jgi:hypothetical protein
MAIAIGYFVEQVLIIVWSLGMIAAAIWQLQVQAQNPTITKPVQKTFIRILLLAGVIELIWSIDPRGVWRIYSAALIACIKDYVLITLNICVIFKLDIVCRVTFEILGIAWLYHAPQWLTCGSIMTLMVIVQAIATAFAVKLNRQGPRSFYILFFAIVFFLLAFGITWSMVYFFSVNKKVGVLSIERQEAWKKLRKLTVLL